MLALPFAFFTVQANLLVGATTLLLAIRLDRSSLVFGTFRLIGLVAITVTGIVYHVALSSLLTLQATAQSTQALAFVGKTAVVDGSTAAVTNGKATWDLSVPTDSSMNISITNSTGQTVFTGSYPVNAGDSQAFGWDGKGNDGTQWPDGKYTLTAQAADGSGNSVAVSTEIVGVVSSVDLTQSPPLLSINGQNYTVDQIKGISG